MADTFNLPGTPIPWLVKAREILLEEWYDLDPEVRGTVHKTATVFGVEGIHCVDVVSSGEIIYGEIPWT